MYTHTYKFTSAVFTRLFLVTLLFTISSINIFPDGKESAGGEKILNTDTKALELIDEKVPGAAKIEITGVIASLSPYSITISQSNIYDSEILFYQFSVDEKTAVYNYEKEPVSYKEINTGVIVEVTGFVLAGGKYHAARIQVKESAAYKIEMHGQVEDISKTSVTVNKIIFFTDANTVFIDNLKMPSIGAVVSVGVWVRVKGIKRTDGTYYASQISIEDAVKGGTIAEDRSIMETSLKENKSAGTEESLNMIEDFELHQNYPNPFNPSTNISFSIQKDQHVSLRVFNAIGEEVRTLVNNNLSQGTYSYNFNAEGLTSGLYIYRLESGEQVQTKKMVLLK